MPAPALVSSFPVAPEVPPDADEVPVSTPVPSAEEATIEIVASNPERGPVRRGSSPVGVENSSSGQLNLASIVDLESSLLDDAAISSRALIELIAQINLRHSVI